MRTILILLLTFACLPLIGGDTHLQYYIELGLQNNLDLQMAAKGVEASNARQSQAFAGFLPSVDFSSVYLDNQEGTTIDLGTYKLPIQPKITTSTGLEATQVLFSPAVYYNYRMQRAQTYGEQYAYETQKQMTTLDIWSGYYDCMKADQMLKMRQSSVDLAKENLKLTQSMFDVEKVPQTDLLRAKVGLMSSQQDLRDAQNQLSLARNNFNRILNRDMNADILLDSLATATLSTLDIHGALPAPQSVDEAISTAQEQRPEIRQIDASVRTMHEALKANFSAYLPSLVGIGDYGFSGTSYQYDHNDDAWTIKGVLSWNLFSGFKTTARQRELRATSRQMEMSADNVRHSIELDVRNAYLGYTHDLDQFGVAQDTYVAAQSNYNMVRQQYENELAPMVTLTDAKSLLDSAQANLIVSYFNAQVSYAKYQKSIGNPVH